ncbi:hypothetical protein BVRB_4g081770 [Beta vulgaris subsp. vulgaris]|nr:hypothetical protein BVRB_4g081770 [Beta vulgaris subsp. vulgaris]
MRLQHYLLSTFWFYTMNFVSTNLTSMCILYNPNTFNLLVVSHAAVSLDCLGLS